MTPSLFLLQTAILFLPGVVWARLDNKYCRRPDDGQLWFLLRALMFGLVSHMATWFLYWAASQEYIIPNLVVAGTESVITDRIGWQTLWATLVGFLLAILWMYFVNNKVLTRVLQGIKATKTYGDEDVWDYTFNSSDAASEYVHVRDFANQIVYAGWVSTFSESEKLRELVLTKVKVYGFDGVEMFETPRVYLARQPEGIHIEFPYIENESGQE